jgi:hypothetical protein
MKKFWIIVVVFGVLFSGCRAVEPSDEELTLDMQHSSLAGLEGVGVLIRMNPKAKERGLEADELQGITELGLRQNGIKVLTYEERLKASGQPYLDIAIAATVSPDELNIKAVGISVALKQTVILERDPTIRCINVETWDEAIVLVGGISKIDGRVKEYVKKYVDRFCNDYIAANPIERPVQPKDKEKEGTEE